MFPVQKLLFYATDAQTPDITLSLFWQLTCLFVCRLACATFSRAAVAFLYSLLQRYRVRHARANTQPGAGTDTAENVLLKKLTAIVNACHQDPAPMTSAIHNFLVEYVDGEKARREEWLAKMKRFLNGRYNDKITGHNARQTARLEELNLQASQDIKRKLDDIEARYQRDIAGAQESMKRGTRRDVGGNDEPRQSTVEGTDAINDANEPTHHDTLPTDDETLSGEIGKKGKSGIKNASEQHHHDTPHTDDETLSGEIGKRGKSGIKDASEPTQQTKYQPPTLRLLEVEATEIQPMKTTTGTEKEIENVNKEVSVTTTSDAAQAPPADLLHPTLDEVSIVVRNFLLSLPTKGASEDDDPGAAQSKDEDPEEGELEGKTSTGGTSGEADSKDLSPEDNGVEGEMAIKDADGEDDTCAPQGEDVDPENNEVEGKTGAQEGILSPHHNRGTKLMFSPEDLAMLDSPPVITHNKTQDEVMARHLQEGFDLQANKRLSFLEQRIIHLEMGYGTPEDPDAEPSSSLAESASLTEELSDAEIARLLWEEELAQWRHARILYYKAEAEILRARIHGQGPDSISKSNKRAIKRKQLTDRLRCVAGSSSNTISDEDDMNNEESDAEADP